MKTDKMRKFLANYTLLFILIVLYAVFSIVMPSTFGSFDNLLVVVTSKVVLLLVALGMLLPMIVGEFDLSAPSILGLSQIIVAGFTIRLGLPFVVAALIALVVSLLIGFINAAIITRFQINSIMTGLGMAAIIYAIVYGYTNGGPIIGDVPTDLVQFARGDFFGIRYAVLYMIALYVLLWYILEHTPAGRYLYAIGGSKDAARLSGINVRRYMTYSFMGSALIAGFGGVILAGQLGVGQPNQGPQLLMPALTGVFLGAAGIKAGIPNVRGLFIAVMLLALGVNGLILAGVPFWVESLYNGLALILGMVLVRWLNREAI